LKIYWTAKSIPELAELSPKERNKAWRACVWNCYKHWQTWLGLAICGFVAGTGACVGSLVANNVPPILMWHLLIVGLCSGIGGGIGGLVFGQIATNQIRPYLKAYIAKQVLSED